MSALSKSRNGLLGCVSGLIFVIGIGHFVPVKADSENAQIAPVPQHLALQYGETSISGENGEYMAQVLVKAPTGKAWEVLTDYDNFKHFMPNVSDSKLLSAEGNRKVFEQVNEFQVLFFTKQARVRISTAETYPQQIDFQLIEGDVASLKGSWQLTTPEPDMVLITHQVAVDPGANNREIFFQIYKNTLKDTITALKTEIESRPN